MKPQCFVVVEPHADDAFLSLGQHIEDWVKSGNRVVILTVFGTQRRLLEAKDYATDVGAEWQGVFCEEKEHETLEQLGDEEFPVEKLKQSLRNHFLRSKSGIPIHTIFLPLGIKHPEHKVVAKTAPYWDGIVCQYFDQPYASVRKNRKEVQDASAGLELVSYCKPFARKYRHIPTFKSQAKFFFNNPASKLQESIELIVSDSGTAYTFLHEVSGAWQSD